MSVNVWRRKHIRRRSCSHGAYLGWKMLEETRGMVNRGHGRSNTSSWTLGTSTCTTEEPLLKDVKSNERPITSNEDGSPCYQNEGRRRVVLDCRDKVSYNHGTVITQPIVTQPWDKLIKQCSCIQDFYSKCKSSELELLLLVQSTSNSNVILSNAQILWILLELP